jgi:taurine dioxygenase
VELEIAPTGGPLGATVHGVDLAQDPPSDVVRQILEAFRDHLVLIFRGQQLTRERIVQIAEWFGGCYRPHPDEPTLGDASLDPIVVVSNVHERGVLGSGSVRAHADQEYLRHPSAATLLYAVEVPTRGGETSWANLIQAYGDLSAWSKLRIRGLQRWTENPYAAGNVGVRGATGPHQRVVEAEYPVVLHPLVRVRPETGERALYLSDLTTGIRGTWGLRAGRRARKLLRRLKAHVDRPDRYFTHAWRPGDFVIWDNIYTNHKRAAFSDAERRVMYRCQIVAR